MGSGKNPLPSNEAYLGVTAANPPNIVKSTRNPSTNDKKYPVGTMWMNTSAQTCWQLVAPGGVWNLLGSGSTGGVQTVTGDSGGALSPSSGNITLAGTSAQGIVSSGSGSTITLTASDWTTAQKGVGVLSTNAQAIAGVGTTQAVTPAALLAKLGATQTNHGVILGGGNTAAFGVTAAGTTGQVLAGVTGADPAFSALSELNFSDVTGATQTLAVGTTYLADHASATVVFTLPATAAQGSVIKIFGYGIGGWQINQNANQAIKCNGLSSTTGTGGSVSSLNRYSQVTLLAAVGGASTIWVATSPSALIFV